MARRLIAVQKNKERKMQKTAAISGLVLLLVVFSTMHLGGIKPVEASTGAANFLPNCYIPPPEGFDTQNELDLSLDVAEYITTTLANYNSPYGCYYSYEEQCTVSSYCSILSSLKDNYDEAIVFSKGHRSIPQSDPLHISLLDHNRNDLYDHYYYDDIYSRTSSGNVFTFIWHCETARWYPEGAQQDGNGHYHGMPYCWTHNSNLGYYGYSGDQVFLGWNNNVPYPDPPGGSPQYEFEINPNYNYANVAGMFWYYMCNGYTVAQALINLSYMIYGTSFEYTPLAEWLIVWGNVYLGLP